MQRLWRSDALDFWKNLFLQTLLQSPKVLPLFSDAGWTVAEIETYANILGLTKPTRSSDFSAYAKLGGDVLWRAFRRRFGAGSGRL
ncbi:MAG: hypothetical protein AUK47_12635 [Deltaproteobacteria bacterium CG2_30_63_29]|nr:MAG: hypothetical protein AUK47_12635 [Deltaproteobacteria bacterium CG2_30_63_29]